MRKLQMKMNLSADAFVAPANGNGNWIFKNSDETSRNWSVAHSEQAGLIIMGRKSFESMAPYWPTADGPFATLMNEIPKAVFTKAGYKGIGTIKTTTTEQADAAVSWEQARIIDGDLSQEIKKLKSEEGKPILALGGAGFMRSLIATGLIDEYYLVIHPLVMGSGLPIFNGVADQLQLKLADVKSFPGGIVVHIYRPE
jgi:dihydrofolate reductase